MSKKRKKSNPNPLLEKKYQQGRRDQRMEDVAFFAVRLERIDSIKGIGKQRSQAIKDVLEKETTPEENKKMQKFIRQLLESEERSK